MSERKRTPRGFTIYDEFADTYGANIRVQESSSAEGPRVWIFADGHEHNPDPRPHLDVAQAIRLRDALTVFIAENSECIKLPPQA